MAFPLTTSPEAGSTPIWPATTIQSPARTALEYGPPTQGSVGVGIAVTGIGARSGRGRASCRGSPRGGAEEPRVVAQRGGHHGDRRAGRSEAGQRGADG